MHSATAGLLAAETPKVLALMLLGRQSAERERISEINSNFLK
ncbi:hypothetical protein ACIP97_04035 [Peribacillus frigoritolerans]